MKLSRAGIVGAVIVLLGTCTGCTVPLSPDTIATTAPAGPVDADSSTSRPSGDPIEDSGPIDGADGTAIQDGDGEWHYTVVAGDVGGVICDRFGRNYWQLERESGTNQGFDCYSAVFPGDVVRPTDDVKPN